MNWFEAIVLGLVQGFTEFLPVSSSGHLELGKSLFGIDHEKNFYFSVAVHGATVLSTIVALRVELTALLKGFFRFRLNDETRYILKLAVSMIPIAVAGLFMTDIERIYQIFAGNMILLGILFLVTASLLLLAYLARSKERQIGFIDSLVIGLAQVIAVLPGISRSGATIATGIMLGNRKSDIARFSFLMVIIPVMGVNMVKIFSGDFSTEGTLTPVILAGAMTAFISGYIACRWMINLVRRGKLLWFAVYCILVGIFTLFSGLNVF